MWPKYHKIPRLSTSQYIQRELKKIVNERIVSMKEYIVKQRELSPYTSKL